MSTLLVCQHPNWDLTNYWKDSSPEMKVDEMFHWHNQGNCWELGNKAIEAHVPFPRTLNIPNKFSLSINLSKYSPVSRPWLETR